MARLSNLQSLNHIQGFFSTKLISRILSSLEGVFWFLKIFTWFQYICFEFTSLCHVFLLYGHFWKLCHDFGMCDLCLKTLGDHLYQRLTMDWLNKLQSRNHTHGFFMFYFFSREFCHDLWVCFDFTRFWHVFGIRQCFRNESIASKFSIAECHKMWSDMLHAFLNDNHCSWTLEKHLKDKEDSERKMTNQGQFDMILWWSGIKTR